MADASCRRPLYFCVFVVPLEAHLCTSLAPWLDLGDIHAAPKTAQGTPGPPQGSPGHVQGSPKHRPGTPQDSPRHPRGPIDRPRAFPVRPNVPKVIIT